MTIGRADPRRPDADRPAPTRRWVGAAIGLVVIILPLRSTLHLVEFPPDHVDVITAVWVGVLAATAWSRTVGAAAVAVAAIPTVWLAPTPTLGIWAYSFLVLSIALLFVSLGLVGGPPRSRRWGSRLLGLSVLLVVQLRLLPIHLDSLRTRTSLLVPLLILTSALGIGVAARVRSPRRDDTIDGDLKWCDPARLPIAGDDTARRIAAAMGPTGRGAPTIRVTVTTNARRLVDALRSSWSPPAEPPIGAGAKDDRARFALLRDLGPGSWAAVAAVAGLLVGIVGWRVLQSPWLPHWDESAIVLRAQGLPERIPLTGAWSSAYAYGQEPTSQLGPAWSFVYFIPIHLFGVWPGVPIAAATANVAMIALACWSSYRVFGRIGAAIALFGTLLTVLLTIGGGITSVLNVDSPVLPFLLVLIVAAMIAEGDLAQAPLLLVAAALVIHAEILYAPVVGGVVVGALVLGALRRNDSTPVRRTVLVSIAALIVVWAPTVIDQVWGDHNLSTLVGQLGEFGSNGWTGALAALEAVLYPRSDALAPFTFGVTVHGLVFVALVTIGAAAFVAFVRPPIRTRGGGLLVVLGLMMVGIVITGIGFPSDDAWLPHYYWIRTGSVFVTIAVALLVVTRWRPAPLLLQQLERRSTALIATVFAVLFVALAVVATAPTGTPPDWDESEALSRALRREIQAATSAGTYRVAFGCPCFEPRTHVTEREGIVGAVLLLTDSGRRTTTVADGADGTLLFLIGDGVSPPTGAELVARVGDESATDLSMTRAWVRAQSTVRLSAEAQRLLNSLRRQEWTDLSHLGASWPACRTAPSISVDPTSLSDGEIDRLFGPGGPEHRALPRTLTPTPEPSADIVQPVFVYLVRDRDRMPGDGPVLPCIPWRR